MSQPLTAAEYLAFHHRLLSLGQDEVTAAARTETHFAERLAADALRPPVGGARNVSTGVTLNGKALSLSTRGTGRTPL